MPDMELLAEMIDRASVKHGGASGRRLAEIAAADGFEVSHSTLNKIRKGTYESEPSPSTLRAIAHLAKVSEHTLLARYRDPVQIQHSEIHRAFVEWLNGWYRLQNLTLDYARLRGIPFDDAEGELRHVRDMFEDQRNGTGRPWTPPWNPGASFQPGEEPWNRAWWAVAEPSVDRPGVIRIAFGDWDIERVRAYRARLEKEAGSGVETSETADASSEGDPPEEVVRPFRRPGWGKLPPPPVFDPETMAADERDKESDDEPDDEEPTDTPQDDDEPPSD